jgi:hypothetical protein
MPIRPLLALAKDRGNAHRVGEAHLAEIADGAADEGGATALHMAVCSGDDELCWLLTALGADPHAPTAARAALAAQSGSAAPPPCTPMGIAAACAHAMSSECAVAMERGAAVYRTLPGSSQAERNAYAVAAPRACAFDGMRIRGTGG